jgi:hypothetical protein
MSYRPFVIPEYHEFIDAVGVAPEPLEDEPAQRLILEGNGELMVVTFDVAGRSVHCRWSCGERVLSEVFHEGAILLRIETSGERVQLNVDLEADGSKGQLALTVTPEFEVYSRILLR